MVDMIGRCEKETIGTACRNCTMMICECEKGEEHIAKLQLQRERQRQLEQAMRERHSR